MTAFEQIPAAGLGWLELISGRPEARDQFDYTRSGFVVAMVLYFALVLLTIFVRGLAAGALPGYAEVFPTMIANALPLGVLGIAIFLTVAVLGLKIPVFALLVPSTYALAILLVVSLPLIFIPFDFAPALLGMLGFTLYREARVIAQLNIALSIAFAAFCILALVMLQLSLYMLLAPGDGPI